MAGVADRGARARDDRARAPGVPRSAVGTRPGENAPGGPCVTRCSPHSTRSRDGLVERRDDTSGARNPALPRPRGRRAAARRRLRDYAGRDDVVVLGAAARRRAGRRTRSRRRCDAPLDVFLVRKLGVPGHEEHALGAIASGGMRVLNTQLIESLGPAGRVVEAIDAKERRELQRRERAYRGDRPPPDVAGRTVILVDDGLATGATMLAALHAVRADEPGAGRRRRPGRRTRTCARRCAATPTRSCALLTPQPLHAVGRLVRGLLADDRRRGARAARARRAVRPPSRRGARERCDRSRGEAVATTTTWSSARPRRRFVLIGEASHGTHEFYRERAEITKRLIAEARLHRRRGRGRLAGRLPRQPLRARRRATTRRGGGAGATSGASRPGCGATRRGGVRDAGCASYNDALPRPARRRSASTASTCTACTRRWRPWSSTSTSVDPEAAQRRARALRLLRPVRPRPAGLRVRGRHRRRASRASSEVVQQLVELQRRRAELAGARRTEPTRQFFAEQNARLVRQRRGVLPRDVPRRRRELEPARPAHGRDARRARRPPRAHRGPAKVVVWAHNSHLGDARATELAQAAQLNVGQLVRERHGDEALLVGFTTYEGTVTAASDWGGPAERKRVPPRAARAAGRSCSTSAAPDRFWLEPARAARPAAGARDRRRLPARDRAHLALLPRAARRPVRRGHPPRRDARARAARAHERMGGRRAARDLSMGGLNDGRQAPQARLRPCEATHRRAQGRPRRPRRLERAPAVRGRGERVHRRARIRRVRALAPRHRRRAAPDTKGHYKFPYGDFRDVAPLRDPRRGVAGGPAQVHRRGGAAAHLHGMLETLRQSSPR